MATAVTARTTIRVAVGLLVGAGLGLTGATSAAADVDPSPTSTQYPPPEEPTLTADVLQPICDGDVPYLRYVVSATGTDADTLTLTWVNPTGEDVVLTDLPLEGRVLWPGAVADTDGTPLDWPGWRLEDGVWVEGDEYDWVRPFVTVHFQVNPELTATAAYPPSSPSCATNPPGTPPTTPPDEESPEPGETVAAPVPGEAAPPGAPAEAASSGATFLPQTGAEVATLVAVAGGLVVVGGLTVAAVRRRRTSD